MQGMRLLSYGCHWRSPALLGAVACAQQTQRPQHLQGHVSRNTRSESVMEVNLLSLV